MSAGLKQLAGIALFAVLVGCVPFVTTSGVTLNFVMMALYATLIAQAWNILGGFGGQFSFGHALFFGTGAYIQAIAQLQGGINAWAALPLAVIGAAARRPLHGRPAPSATASRARTSRSSRWPLPRCSASSHCRSTSPAAASG